MNTINKNSKLVWIQIDGNSRSMVCMEPDIGYWESFDKANEIIGFVKDEVLSFCLTKYIDLDDNPNYESALSIAKEHYKDDKKILKAIDKIEKTVKKLESGNKNISTINRMFDYISKQCLNLDITMQVCCFNTALEASWLAKARLQQYGFEYESLTELFESDTLC